MQLITVRTFVIVIISAAFKHCRCVVTVSKFRRHDIAHVRLSPAVSSTVSPSSTSCARLCKNSLGCIAINFRSDTNTCELLDKTGYFKDYETTPDGEWRVYSDITGIFSVTNCLLIFFIIL